MPVLSLPHHHPPSFFYKQSCAAIWKGECGDLVLYEIIMTALSNSLILSPRYNHTGWLGVKHQFTYFLSLILHSRKISKLESLLFSIPFFLSLFCLLFLTFKNAVLNIKQAHFMICITTTMVRVTGDILLHNWARVTTKTKESVRY